MFNAFLANVNSILNLCEPGAFVFDVPCALSLRDVSSPGVTKDSVTVKPTLTLGVAEYFSNINVCAET